MHAKASGDGMGVERKRKGDEERKKCKGVLGTFSENSRGHLEFYLEFKILQDYLISNFTMLLIFVLVCVTMND